MQKNRLKVFVNPFYVAHTKPQKIKNTYQFREEEKRYACRVSMEEIEKNDFNLNISRYVSTTKIEMQIDLGEVHTKLETIEEKIASAQKKHNKYLDELGLPPLPS